MSTETPKPKISMEQLAAALEAGNAIVCGTYCYPCQFDEHESPPRWHTWADDEDTAHAAENGQSDPRDSRCSCRCADARRTDTGLGRMFGKEQP